MKRTGVALTLCGAALASVSGYAVAPTFQELMNPDVFPEPQRGMTVERVALEGELLRVVTTGAEMTFDVASGQMRFYQRIGHPREVVSVEMDDGAAAPELTRTGPGLAFARFDTPRFDLRANGDSLFMIYGHEPIALTVTRHIDAGFAASYGSNHLLLDEWGGFGLYCSEKDLKDGFDPYGAPTARYALPAGAVLWVGVCPPKPYDWERSITDHVVWHWSNTLGYPMDRDLVSWAGKGNIVLLQSEVMLWKDWNLAFVPRLGEPEFARVRNTLHDRDMRFIVYTSPYYFLRGTPLEPLALNSFDNFKGWPPGSGTGDNIDLFMAEITKVMTQYKPDGLYFDGQYTDSPAALYALARRTRALLGEEGILEWHSTAALGPGLCYLPQADAYVDFILRGEGRDGNYEDDAYLRYFVSGYNASNSIGVLCNNGPAPTPELVRRLLDVNGRMHTIAGWLNNPQLVALLDTEYKPRLTRALQAGVDARMDARQTQVAARAAMLAAEQTALKNPPAWDAPLLVESFDSLPEWKRQVSPENAEPFAIAEGALAVTGKAHTYAFLTRPLGPYVGGFIVKLRQHTDGGMSWGPGACIRWKNGAILRVGLRSDGLLQADISGEQLLAGTHDPGKWVWLRARWQTHSGVIERSDDGQEFQPVWTFTHGGRLIGEAENVSVGKVPYNGQARDHVDPGVPGTCFVDELAVYGAVPAATP